MNSSGTLFHDKIFSLTFPWLLTTSLTFPWHVSNSLTFPGFPDKWSPCNKLLIISDGTAMACYVRVTENHVLVIRSVDRRCWLADSQHEQSSMRQAVTLHPARKIAMHCILSHWHLHAGVTTQFVPAYHLLFAATKMIHYIWFVNINVQQP